VALAVLVCYVAAITTFGAWLGRRQRSVQGYFLAGRSVPWWAVAACVVATETSTLTFIGVPGMAYGGDWTFLQLAFGYLIGRLLIGLLFLPAYFRGELYTSYEMLQRRFGGSVRAASAGIFLLYRTLGDGIRLHAAALVLAVAAGGAHWEWAFILALGFAMILYTEEGGVAATIWTDAIQMFVYLAGAAVCLAAVIRGLPEGAGAALAAASAAGKLRVFDFSLALERPFTLWAGVVGGVFLTLATHGTDHYLVQRLLVARSRRDAALGLTLSGVLVFVQFALFLLLGSLLWAFYSGRSFARGDEVLPTFVTSELPDGWMGFILAAIVAAALSPSLNSMAVTTLRDFYLPYFRPAAGEVEQLRAGRLFTVFWGVCQIAVALLARNVDSALNEGLAALSYASGPTVGAFLLAVLTRRANASGTLAGMAAGLVVSLCVGRLAPYVFGWPGVAWTWNVAVGALVTMLLGWLASRYNPAMSITLRSPSFEHQGSIPMRHTCEGDDVSPALEWNGLPAGTQSLALIVDDPDAPDPNAPRMTYVHWVLYNLPPGLAGLPEGVGSAGLPAGTREGTNDWKRTGYGGPCPPIGRHRYFHKLYALDSVLPDLGPATKAQLEGAIEGHVLARTELIGTYQKSRQ
jgi:SSS family solute:Na+ symporter